MKLVHCNNKAKWKQSRLTVLWCNLTYFTPMMFTIGLNWDCTRSIIIISSPDLCRPGNILAFDWLTDIWRLHKVHHFLSCIELWCCLSWVWLYYTKIIPIPPVLNMHTYNLEHVESFRHAVLPNLIKDKVSYGRFLFIVYICKFANHPSSAVLVCLPT